MFDLPFDFTEAFSVEKEKAKQQFIIRNHPLAQSVFSDTRELEQHHAVNLRTGQHVPVPQCDFFCAGFSCKSRSSLNNNAAAMLHCVQQSSGETGQTFKDCLAYIKGALPRVLLLENVAALDQGASDTQTSDAQYIVAQLAELNYCARWMPVCASMHGSFARRDRIYLVGFLAKDDAEFDRMSSALADCESLLSSLYIDPFPMQAFLVDGGATVESARETKDSM